MKKLGFQIMIVLENKFFSEFYNITVNHVTILMQKETKLSKNIEFANSDVNFF